MANNFWGNSEQNDEGVVLSVRIENSVAEVTSLKSKLIHR